jgi:hypothetical protein
MFCFDPGETALSRRRSDRTIIRLAALELSSMQKAILAGLAIGAACSGSVGWASGMSQWWGFPVGYTN